MKEKAKLPEHFRIPLPPQPEKRHKDKKKYTRKKKVDSLDD